jgi:hypothetical protein
MSAGPLADGRIVRPRDGQAQVLIGLALQRHPGEAYLGDPHALGAGP